MDIRKHKLMMVVGTLQGKISLWDIAKQAVRVECENASSSGVTKLFWAPNHTLFCGTLDGAIRAFDGRSGQLKVNFSHSSGVQNFNGRFVVFLPVFTTRTSS